MKVLLYASVASMIGQFNMENIKILLRNGFQVHVACNFENGNSVSQEEIETLKKELIKLGVIYYQVPIPRNITSYKEIINSYKITKKLLMNHNFDIIHFHSPIGAAVGRMAAKTITTTKTKIIYTAHGFHFYKGSSIFSWLIYYPIEFYLSNYTDVIITINKEDFSRAKQLLRSEIIYVPGIGIKTEVTTKLEFSKEKLRDSLKISPEEIVFISVGELNKNKNHIQIIKSLANFKVSFKYIICGQGEELENLKETVNELELNDKVMFLGYRSDVKELLFISDVYCFPSKREGLSVALMEAMVAGLPCIVSRIRGNIDLIDANGGFLFDLDDENQLKHALKSVIDSKDIRVKMGKYNSEKIKCFDSKIVNSIMEKIYLSINS